MNTVVNWLAARRDNALRIADLRSGDDRAGWLEDANYFAAAVRALDVVPDLLTALRELIALDETYPHDGSTYDRAYAAIAKATSAEGGGK
jgi:hypothetical protein